jgi:hypothetical protein
MEATMDVTRERAFRPEMAAELGTGTRRPGWDAGTERRIDDGESLANAIGWFSIGLGMAELVAPRRIARWLGMEEQSRLLQLYGAREVTKGVGILSRRRPLGWMWGRVAGDALDLATLATGLRRGNRRRRNVLLAMGAVAGVTALDLLCVKQLSEAPR